MTQSSTNLIWIDLEMTGLDTDNDTIIEIATIVTDGRLNALEEGPVIAIHQEDSMLEAMDEWNTRQHTKSGLVERVRNSPNTIADAEHLTLEFVEKFVPPKASPMCGNSICQDRRFLHRLMPKLESYFHYRHIDVSTIKEIVKRWYPDGKQLKKESSHLALEDIRDSINELRFYQENYFTG